MEYKIISKSGQNFAKALKNLEEDVNEHTKKDWKPLEGIKITNRENKYYILQVIVKE